MEQQSLTGRRTDIYETDPTKVLDRGQKFFERVYGKVAKRVMRQMDTSGTEDLGLIARLMYAHILSNTRILNGAETSYVLIAALIPQDVCCPPQTRSDIDDGVGKPAIEGPLERGSKWWSNA